MWEVCVVCECVVSVCIYVYVLCVCECVVSVCIYVYVLCVCVCILCMQTCVCLRVHRDE